MIEDINQPSVYVSSDPSVIAACKAALDNRAEFNAALDVFLAEHGLASDQVAIDRFGGRETIVGVFPNAGDDEATPRAPRGWRMGNRGVWVPSIKTAAGKKIQLQLDALPKLYDLRLYLSELAGMPAIHMAAAPRGMAILHPAVAARPAGEPTEVWVRWSCVFPPMEKDPHDAHALPVLADHWRKVPLSEYFGMVESGQDPFAAAAERSTAGGAE